MADCTADRVDYAALDRLGDEIAELSAHLEAATARLLELIREFDERGGWDNGFTSCAAWLSWRVGLDLGAARERVRVARALPTLPRLSQALARGELSYAKVRALTRVATPETEERLLAIGRAGTAWHVERIVRGWRRVDRNVELCETVLRHSRRTLRVYQDEDGMVRARAAHAGGRRSPDAGTGRGPRDAIPTAAPDIRERRFRGNAVGAATAVLRATASGGADPAGRNGAASRNRSGHRRGALPGRGPCRCSGAGGCRCARPISRRRRLARFRGNVTAAGV
jgi:hypothetical protein